MIRKVGGGKFQLFSKKTGKPLSKPESHAAVVKREHQVEFFKHRDRIGKR